MFPKVIKFIKEAWDRGVSHYYEDTKLDITINKYNFPFAGKEDDHEYHILIAIDGRLKYNKLRKFKSWEEAEKFAIEKAEELYV